MPLYRQAWYATLFALVALQLAAVLASVGVRLWPMALAPVPTLGAWLAGVVVKAITDSRPQA